MHLQSGADFASSGTDLATVQLVSSGAVPSRAGATTERMHPARVLGGSVDPKGFLRGTSLDVRGHGRPLACRINGRWSSLVENPSTDDSRVLAFSLVGMKRHAALCSCRTGEAHAALRSGRPLEAGYARLPMGAKRRDAFGERDRTPVRFGETLIFAALGPSSFPRFILGMRAACTPVG